MVIIIAGATVALLLLWIVSCRRRLTVMNENIDSAMVQIDIQLSACFNILTSLLNLTSGYAARETQTLIETVGFLRSAIKVTFTPDDVLKQESIIAEALDCISMMAERYPDLKTNENYTKCMNAMDSYEKMVRTSSLIYNDSVTKLNRELRMFPASLIAGIFGFRQREYLEAVDNKGD